MALREGTWKRTRPSASRIKSLRVLDFVEGTRTAKKGAERQYLRLPGIHKVTSRYVPCVYVRTVYYCEQHWPILRKHCALHAGNDECGLPSMSLVCTPMARLRAEGEIWVAAIPGLGAVPDGAGWSSTAAIAIALRLCCQCKSVADRWPVGTTTFVPPPLSCS